MIDEQKAYRESVEAKVEQWAAELAKYRAKAKELGAEAKLEVAEQLRNAEMNLSKLRGELQQLGDAADGGWDKAKSRVQGTYDAIRESIADLANR